MVVIIEKFARYLFCHISRNPTKQLKVRIWHVVTKMQVTNGENIIKFGTTVPIKKTSNGKGSCEP